MRAGSPHRRFEIAGNVITDDSDCFVIAEIGANHKGDLELCKQLFRAARDCGADAVKLQKRNNDELFTREFYDKPYDHANSFGPTYGAHREFLEFGRGEYLELQAYARELDIFLLATAFDLSSADFLEELNMPAYKIASGDLTNIPLIRKVAGFGRPIIISTGGATMEDVRRAHDEIAPVNPNLCIMQCTSAYPPEHDILNLRVIESYRDAFPEIVIGYSGHESGIAMGPVAYVMGARVIEKHFTLNRAWKGTDQSFSLEQPGLRRLVRDLRRTRQALGSPDKQPLPEEQKPLYKLAKKLVAARDLPKGHFLTEPDIAVKIPNDGLPPYEMDNLVGRRLKRQIEADTNITFEDID